MRNVIFLSVCLTVIAGCCSGSGEPETPHGAPDETSRYEGSDGYESITYTYYCYNGKYISYTYIKLDNCADWEQDSKYTSGGICDNDYMIGKLKETHPEERNSILEENGFDVDTAYTDFGVSGKGIFY